MAKSDMTPEKSKALKILRGAAWETGATIKPADAEHLQSYPDVKRFQNRLMERAIPSVSTTNPAVTLELCKAAGLCMGAGQTARNGVLVDSEKGSVMIYGDANLDYLCNMDIPLPDRENTKASTRHTLN